MEDPLTDIEGVNRAIFMMSLAFNDQRDALALGTLTRAIDKMLEAVEDERGRLFRLLHPRRAHFESVGWPGDEQEAA